MKSERFLKLLERVSAHNITKQCSILIACFFITGLLGCASLSQRNPNVESRRVADLQKQLHRQKMIIEELREKNLVLQRRRLAAAGSAAVPEARVESKNEKVKSSVPVPFTPSASGESNMTVPMAVAKPAVKAAETAVSPESDDATLTGEQRLYSKVIDSFRGQKQAELNKALNLLLKTYPDSVHADNALYLAALLAIEKEQPQEALGFLEKILRHYPQSNKTVSALFAKAMIAKKKNQAGEASRILNDIQKKFPGSPESMRVGLELKLLRQKKIL